MTLLAGLGLSGAASGAAAATGATLAEDAVVGGLGAATAASTTLAPTAVIGATATAGLPGWLATAGTAASLLGSGISTIGQVTSAEAQGKSALYQAEVAKNQAQIANTQAQQTAASGEQAASNASMQTRALVGAQQAAQSASGIDSTSGSALDVRASTAMLGEYNAMTIQSNAARQAYGYQTGAVSDLAQSQLYQAQARQAPVAGAIGGLSSLLSGAASGASQYARWQLVAGSGGGGSNVAALF